MGRITRISVIICDRLIILVLVFDSKGIESKETEKEVEFLKPAGFRRLRLMITTSFFWPGCCYKLSVNLSPYAEHSNNQPGVPAYFNTGLVDRRSAVRIFGKFWADHGRSRLSS